MSPTHRDAVSRRVDDELWDHQRKGVLDRQVTERACHGVSPPVDLRVLFVPLLVTCAGPREGALSEGQGGDSALVDVQATGVWGVLESELEVVVVVGGRSR